MSYPYDESSYTPEGYYQVPQYQGYQPPQRGIVGTVSAAFPTPAEDRLRFKQEEHARGGDLLDEVTGSTSGMDRNEYNIQLRTMAEQVNEFDTRMKMLNGVQKRMDPMGQKRLAEIMKRHEGLQNALNHGKISQLEMFRGASMLNQELGQFNWEAHTNGPGSAVGDVYEKDGYWFHNKPGEGPVPFDYTADERQKRTVRNPITGHVTIPTAPGKEPKILSPSELDDLNLEAKRIESLQRKIDKLAGELQQNPLNQKTPEENAAIAERLVGETEQRARRLYSKLYGKEGSLTGQQQTDQVEEEMGIQQPKPTTATHQAQLAQQKKDEKKDSAQEKQAESLIDEHGKLFGIPKGSSKKAEKLGYSKDQIIRALGALNQMRHYFPNANSVGELSPEWQKIFSDSLPILQALKGK